MLRLKSNKYGISLVELSLYIVIVSMLLIGIESFSIVNRRNIIRGVLSEIQLYRESIGQFQTLYGDLPGVLRNANSKLNNNPYVSLNSADITDNNYSSLAIDPFDDTYSANGHFNTTYGAVSYEGTTFGTSNQYMYTPSMQVWLQLYLAGILNKKYSGATKKDGPNYIFTAGIHFPRSTFLSNNVGYGFFYPDSSTLNNGNSDLYLSTIRANPIFVAHPHHVLLISKALQIETNPHGPVMPFIFDNLLSISPYILSKIDQKIDDGLPKTGYMAAYYGNSGNKCYDDSKNSYFDIHSNKCVSYLILKEF